MIAYFMDRHYKIIGNATSNIGNNYNIVDDKKTENLENGVVILEIEIGYKEDGRERLEEYCLAGNYLLCSSESDNEFYTIIDDEIDTESQTIRLYCEDAGLDLINETVGAYEADKAYPISHYVNKWINGSGFVIGVNEISDLSRKLKWDGEATVTERLASVATQFEHAEVSYSFSVKGLTVDKMYVNIYKKRGKDTQQQLRLGKEISSIRRKRSIAEVATALRAVGAQLEEKEGQPQKYVTLQGYKYDDGEFYVDGELLVSRTALQKWGRYNATNNNIVRQYSYDTKEQKTLCNSAITALKKRINAEITLEVDIVKLPKGVNVGDRINIIDDKGNMYLSSRILKLETSQTNNTKTAVLGEHIAKGSGISEKVQELAENFKKMAETRKTFTWIAYADDEQGTGITINPKDKKYIGIAANQSMPTVVLTDTTVFKWSKIKGEDGEKGEDGFSPIIKPFKNENKVTITIKDKEGDKTVEFSEGKDGKGIVSMETERAVGNSETEPPVDGWKAVIGHNPNPVKYTWERFRIDYTDGSKTYTEPHLIENGEIQELKTTIAQINILAESIQQTVETNKQSISSLGVVEEQIKNLFGIDETGFSFRFEQMTKKLTALGEEITNEREWIRLVKGGIVIGKSDSPVTSEYTTDGLRFLYNGNVVAEFNKEFLEVKNVNVKNQLRFANEKWAIRPGRYVSGKGNNLNDYWIGG